MSDFLAAAYRATFRLTAEVEEECRRERAAIDEAIRTKLSIGDNYWKRRHAAQQRLRAALLLVDVLS